MESPAAAPKILDWSREMSDLFPPDPMPHRPPSSRAASTALFLGMVGLVASTVIVGGLIGIAAIYFGRRALLQIQQASGRLRGRAMAQAGIALGYIAILAALAAIAVIIARRHGLLRW
jgi:hypothetical protein